MTDGIDWAQVGGGGRFKKIVSTLHPDSERIVALAATAMETSNWEVGYGLTVGADHHGELSPRGDGGVHPGGRGGLGHRITVA